MYKWIRVEDRLPDKPGSYIICTDRNAVCTAHFYPGGIHRITIEGKSHIEGYFSGYAGKHAKYWRRLPDPPIIENESEIMKGDEK